MSTHHFNAPDTLQILRRRKKIRQRKSYSQSRLMKLRSELVKLRKMGASYREISDWLRQDKRIKIAHTTVMRYLAKCPELKETLGAKLS
jgi:IS30 family transposase